MKTTLKKRVGIGLLLLGSLMLVALPALADEAANGLEAAYEAYLAQQERAEQIAAIEADKDAFAQEIAAKFDLPERVASTLADKDAQTLLEISEAASWEEYIGTQTTSELVFYPLPPCRILDTRFASRWGFNPIPSGGTITIDTWVPWQGGQGGASDCNVISDATAVVLNVTAVPTVGGDGFLTVWPYGQPRPLASLVNYNGNSTANAIANAVVQTQCRSCAHELNIYAWTATHVVADVIGYFARNTDTPLDTIRLSTTQSIPAGATVSFQSPTCTSGYVRTGGNCNPGSSGMEMRESYISPGAPGHMYCTFRNPTGTSQTAFANVICARIPGR